MDEDGRGDRSGDDTGTDGRGVLSGGDSHRNVETFSQPPPSEKWIRLAQARAAPARKPHGAAVLGGLISADPHKGAVGIHAREEEALARAHHNSLRADRRASGSRAGYSAGTIYLLDLLVLHLSVLAIASPFGGRRDFSARLPREFKSSEQIRQLGVVGRDSREAQRCFSRSPNSSRHAVREGKLVQCFGLRRLKGERLLEV